MKLVKRLTAAVVALAVAAPCAAFAANVIYYDADLAKVTYSVDTTENVVSAVASEVAVPTNIVYVEQPSGDGAAVTDAFTMPDLVSVSGKYTVNVVAENGTPVADLYFWHINPTQAAEELAAVIAATNATGVEAAIQAGYADLGIDIGSHTAAISDYLFNLKTSTMTAQEFAKNYAYAKLLSTLNGANEATVTAAVTTYENAMLLGIDAEEYASYPQAVRDEVAGKLSTAATLFAQGKIDAPDFDEEVYEWIALARLNDAQTVIAFQDLLFTTYSSLFVLDMTAYNASNYKQNIIGDMLVPTFTSKEGVVSTFATESAEERGGGGGGAPAGPGAAPSTPGTQTGTAIVIPADPSVIETKTLEDVGGHWAEVTINDLYNKGIVSGSENKFYPNNNITRAEFCTLIVKAFYEGKTGSTAEFYDVNPDNWYYTYVGFLSAKGLVSGMGDGTFGAGKNITRQDMAAIVARVLSDLGKNATATREMATFTDAADIASYSVDAVEMLYKAEVISGYGDGSFMPKANLTKAEAATVIYKLLNK